MLLAFSIPPLSLSICVCIYVFSNVINFSICLLTCSSDLNYRIIYLSFRWRFFQCHFSNSTTFFPSLFSKCHPHILLHSFILHIESSFSKWRHLPFGVVFAHFVGTTFTFPTISILTINLRVHQFKITSIW